MDIRGETTFLTRPESLWLVAQTFLQADGNLDQEMHIVQQEVEARRRADGDRFIAEFGWDEFLTRYGKDAAGNEQTVTEVALDRVKLEIILDHARRKSAELLEAGMDFDAHFANTVTIIDGRDPEPLKGLVSNNHHRDLRVMSGIIAAISAEVEG